MYYYNTYGWLTSEPNPERSTDQTPPAETATQKANWTGLAWVLVEYVAPPAPTPYVEPPIRILTKLAYMNRFTDSELATIYTAAKSVVSVEIWLEKFKLASEINLDDPYTIGGLKAMEAGGLIGAGRAAKILT